jgi:serine/threonine protein kinase
MILFALNFLHGKGIVHLDLKLENLFIDIDENGIKYI